MKCWVSRVALKSGEVVTDEELGPDQNLFDGPPPAIGDLVNVVCRGRVFAAKVVWISNPQSDVLPLRVAEIGAENVDFWMQRNGRIVRLGSINH